jgi:DNA replication protein DnaC
LEALRINELEQLEKKLEEAFKNGKPCAKCGSPLTEIKIGEENGWQRAYRAYDCKCAQETIEEKERLYAALSHQAEIQKRIEQNDPGRFAEARLKDWDNSTHNSQIGQWAHEYVEHFDPKSGNSILILGPTGTGKTHLLYSIVHELIYKGYNARVYNVARWIQDIHFAMRESDHDYKRLIHPLYSTQILGLVDMGKESTTEFTRRALYLVFEERWKHKRPMIVDSNFPSVQALKNHYSNDPVMQDAIVSRLLGMSKNRIWTLRGPDLRLGVNS